MKTEGLIEVILYARDMAAQVNFYRDVLGLQIEYPVGLSDYSQEYWVVFATGACKLVLHGGGQGKLGESAPKIVFGVDNIDASRSELLAAGVSLGEFRSPAPGILVVDGYDPEGNAFSLESHQG